MLHLSDDPAAYSNSDITPIVRCCHETLRVGQLIVDVVILPAVGDSPAHKLPVVAVIYGSFSRLNGHNASLVCF